MDTSLLKLVRHFEGKRAAEGVPGEQTRARTVKGANQGHVRGSQTFHGRQVSQSVAGRGLKCRRRQRNHSGKRGWSCIQKPR